MKLLATFRRKPQDWNGHHLSVAGGLDVHPWGFFSKYFGSLTDLGIKLAKGSSRHKGHPVSRKKMMSPEYPSLDLYIVSDMFKAIMFRVKCSYLGSQNPLREQTSILVPTNQHETPWSIIKLSKARRDFQKSRTLARPLVSRTYFGRRTRLWPQPRRCPRKRYSKPRTARKDGAGNGMDG